MRLGGNGLRLIALLLCAGGLGCQTMMPQAAVFDPTELPGGDGPLRATCTMLAGAAGQQIPIQFREQLRSAVEVTAYEECIEVMVVMVSVAMVSGDTTLEGVATVRENVADADSQYLADTCDDHFRTWRFLRNPERGYTGAVAGASVDPRYDGWMDRCYRILRPLSASPGS